MTRNARLLLAIGIAGTLHLAAQTANHPTFAKDVAPILQANCQSCHRPGEAAPFSLLTYEEARPWAKAIKAAVLQKKMPPWFADPGFGKFSNRPALSAKDVDTLVAWVDAGVPAGDRKDLPPARQFVEGWSIPKPDIVFQLPRPFQVPATGVMEYEYVIIPTGFTKDTWVQAVQAAPTNYRIVHHIVAWVRAPGSKYFKDMPKNEFFEAPPSKTDAAKESPDDVPNDWLTGYAPGQPPDIFKPGQAKLIPAGSDIVLEVHYTTEGKPMSDQSRLGLVLARRSPAERAMTLSAVNSSFHIPPGDPDFRVDASLTMPEDVTLLGLHPHMHMRGKSAEYRFVFPDGRTEKLLSVPRYNWHWQLWYDLDDPLKLPKGTKLECTEHFDNSRNNPENPDPSKTIIWGQQSFDEMAICMINVTFDAGISTKQMLAPERPKAVNAGDPQNIAVGQQPMGVVVNETTNKAYVINHGSNSVTVIDGRTRTAIATVPTGAGPEGIAVNPITNRIYVANAGPGTVTVIDGAADSVVATVKAGTYSQAVAVNPVTNKIYVANNYAHSVTVIDGVTHETATVRVGQGPRAIVVNPVTNKIYTANYGSQDATEIDGATNGTTRRPAGKHPWAIAADTRANKIYVVNEDSASVSIISGATGAVRDVGVGETPFAVAVNPQANRVYVVTYNPSTLVAIDSATSMVSRTVPLPVRPSAIAVNAKTNQIFVASQATGDVILLEGPAHAVAGRTPAGAIPYAMAVDAAANQVYVANFDAASATVIQPALAKWLHAPRFRVLALAERASGDHQSFVDAARRYLDKLAAENDFGVDYINGTERINAESLARYKLLVQLNYPPYHWSPAAKQAFENYVTEGKGGWIGFHHAALLGEFDGYPMDPWFSEFLGGLRFTGYLPDFAKATVKIEDPSSPLAKGLPKSFVIEKEEWYTWSKSPRPNVNVLASVDESSYVPDTPTKMGGDHPVVWSNPKYKGRNLYIFMGHHAGLFDDPNFVQLFRNAVLWGAGE